MGVGAADQTRWTVSRIRHRYGTNLSDDFSLTHADPVRLERRWSRWPQLRVPRGRDGQSFFHVQYVVEHTQRCVSDQAQRWMARRFATAESMWESRHDLWPGEVILDPIESLGIEPRSHAPDGWPPPPPPTPTAQPAAASATPDQPAGLTPSGNGAVGRAFSGQAPSGQALSGQELSGQAPSGQAPSGNSASSPSAPAARRGNTPAAQAEPAGMCAARSPHRDTPPFVLVALFGAALVSRRRRRR
jgi:hypothetical protein